jgi:predicted component of type VI protein secretion system
MQIRVSNGENAGSRLTLEQGRTLILGREHGCDLIVADPRASRRHAEVRSLEGEQVRVRDLGSANGTWVADERVVEAVLTSGQELRIGGVRLAVMAGGEPAPAVQEVAHDPTAPPTYSMVGRLVDSRARRSNRVAVAALGLALLASSGAALAFTRTTLEIAFLRSSLV